MLTFSAASMVVSAQDAPAVEVVHYMVSDGSLSRADAELLVGVNSIKNRVSDVELLSLLKQKLERNKKDNLEAFFKPGQVFALAIFTSDEKLLNDATRAAATALANTGSTSPANPAADAVLCSDGTVAPFGDTAQCAYYFRVPVYQSQDRWEDAVYSGNAFGVFTKKLVCGKLNGNFASAVATPVPYPRCNDPVSW